MESDRKNGRKSVGKMKNKELSSNLYMLLFGIFIISAGWYCNKKTTTRDNTTSQQKIDSVEKAYNDSMYPGFAEPKTQ